MRALPFLGLVPALTPRGRVPKGYARVLVYNADSVLVDSRTQQLSEQALNRYEELAVQVIAAEEGYVTCYVGNESDVDVYFDDVQLDYGPALLVQENHYDPWGLNLVGIERTQGVKPLNQYQFNGKEKQTDLGLGWNDYGARFFDPQIGRGPVIDPLALKHHTVTPYNYVYNNPMNMLDPDGRDAIFTITRDKNGEINGVRISSTVYIQGSGASDFRAGQLNKNANAFFKSKTVDGVKVSFSVNYVYDEDKRSDKLKAGENLLVFNGKSDDSDDGKERSHVNGAATGDVLRGNYQAFTGNTGEVHENGRRDNTIFHETLHFLGLSDRYYEQAGVGNSTVTGYEHDIMGTGGNSIHPKHYRAFAEWAKVAGQTGMSGVNSMYFNSYINKNVIDINRDGSLKYDPNFKYMGSYKEGQLKPIE